MDDWRGYCRGEDGISVTGEVITLRLPNGRRQRIRVRETSDTLELTGVVARQAAIAHIPQVELRAWRHNRAVQLVGFRVDDRGRLVGEAWAPRAGLTRAEFLQYVKHVATECDLFEYHLTGRDLE